MSEHHEVERAYAVGPDDVLPDLGALPGVSTVTEPRTVRLVATYLDTEDLSLVRAGVTLRRRTGGGDAGWHVKVPAGDGRDEVHRPLGSSQHVPDDLARMVTAWSRGRPLVPVAVVETERTTTLLLADDDTVLAEVADDTVAGTPSDGAAPSAWRELEIELVDAGPDLLDAADDLLAAASDIHPSKEQRKIGTVLAARLGTFAPEQDPDPDGPAGPVLLERLVTQVAELRHRDCDVRRGVDDGVHQLRVACRRLRGALATYRPLLDRTVTDPVRDELRWLAQALGDGRDVEVVHGLLRDLVDDLPSDQVHGPVRLRVDSTYAELSRGADAHAQELIGSARYVGLLDDLEALLVETPWTEQAQRPADEVLRGRVARDWRRLERLVTSVPAGRGVEHDESLHDVRKAAKRLRYACEVLEPGWGKPAKRLRKAAQEITQVLGEHQDSAVLRTDLQRIARAAQAAGESTFTYGVLRAREDTRVEQLEVDFAEAWDRARRAKLRAWLD